MATVFVFLLTIVSGVFSEHTKLEWTDCGTDPAYFTINKVDVSPMPIEVPGDIALTVGAVSNKTVTQGDIKISVKRHTFIGDITIPCLFHVGSCEYKDTCTLLDRMEKENWAGIMGGIGTQVRGLLSSIGITSFCNIQARSLDVQSYKLKLPPIPSILSFFAEGDYSAHVTATEAASGHQVACLDLKLSIKKHKDKTCTGWFCGRRRDLH
ncbi:hypothetical protein LOTGIDRAFT_201161 [Lottia gigantea]|uniref:MD-2-related lipid-recognition domain-containing protein n=1 Tax=Lottia gigantea TaxID=225164 RepID=V4A6Z9_LOTGI|nr:hypothetical protein LOTGIDRAFT_201161 [Lottia gigantea]ESO99708.1 hypothetical protein LOTGIDRAFT_201161 [Lottia gigantea]